MRRALERVSAQTGGLKYAGGHAIDDSYLNTAYTTLKEDFPDENIHIVIGMPASSMEPYCRSAHFSEERANEDAAGYVPYGDLPDKPEVRHVQLDEVETDTFLRQNKRSIVLSLLDDLYQSSHAGAVA